jgi:hypothetical protein
LVTDQVSVGLAIWLPCESYTCAENVVVPPGARVVCVGVSEMWSGAPGRTITVAVPATPPITALTVPVYVPALLPAVKAPLLASMAPPPLTTLHAGAPETGLPNESLACAVKFCRPP